MRAGHRATKVSCSVGAQSQPLESVMQALAHVVLLFPPVLLLSHCGRQTFVHTRRGASAWNEALEPLEAPSRIFMQGSMVLKRMPIKRCKHCLRDTSRHHNLIITLPQSALSPQHGFTHLVH
jgi:hypothetical protein